MKPWKVPIRRIAVLVTAAHLLVIVVLIGSGFIELSRDPEPQPITVTLMEESPAPAPAPTPAPVAQDPQPQPEPPPPQPEPPPPQPEPEPEPEPDPAPAPEPEPPPQPKPKPPPPRPKPEPKPAPKPAPKPKPERHYRTPEEIRQSATLRRPSRPRPQPPPPTLPSFDADRFAKNLQQGITEITVAAAPSRTSSSSTPPSSASPQRWYDAVGAELYRLWRQPTRAEVGHGNPDVTVSLEVAADGRVINARIVRRSGVAAMDSSVDQLIGALTSVAGFKRFGLEGVTRSVTITFRVK